MILGDPAVIVLIDVCRFKHKPCVPTVASEAGVIPREIYRISPCNRELIITMPANDYTEYKATQRVWR